MDAGRGGYFCGIVLGFTLGFAAAHVAFSARHAAPDAAPTQFALNDLTVEPSGPNPTVHHVPLPVDVVEDQRAVQAIADLPAETTPSDAAAPRHFEAPDKAVPISAHVAPEDESLKAMILAELASSPASDRDVWYETLRELPPEDAVTILRLWKATHTETALPLSSVPPLPAPVIDKPASVATAPKPAVVSHPENSASAGPRDICLHNLANAETPGFKRCEPHGGSVLDVGAKPDRVTPVAASIPATSDFRFDMSQGEIRESGAPFDLAIDGPGFFEIRIDGESLYTRCGRFVLDAERKLVLRLSDGRVAVLSPQIRIPDEAQSIQINRLGHVLMSTAGAEVLQRVAEIPLCRFLDPSALDPAGQCLFKVSETSGPAWRANSASGKGELVQGSFEASNVDASREKAILAGLPAVPLVPSQAVKTDARIAEEPTAEIVQ